MRFFSVLADPHLDPKGYYRNHLTQNWGNNIDIHVHELH